MYALFQGKKCLRSKEALSSIEEELYRVLRHIRELVYVVLRDSVLYPAP